MYKKEVHFILEMTVKKQEKTSGCLRPRGHKRAHCTTGFQDGSGCVWQ